MEQYPVSREVLSNSELAISKISKSLGLNNSLLSQKDELLQQFTIHQLSDIGFATSKLLNNSELNKIEEGFKFLSEQNNFIKEELENITSSVQSKNYLTNIIIGLIVYIISTLVLQPLIENVILNKSQIKTVLLPEIKQGLKKEKLTNYRIVIVKSHLNVRTKPKLKSNKIFHLSNGDLVEIIKKRKNWSLIKKYDSENETIIQGWVNTRYLLRIK